MRKLNILPNAYYNFLKNRKAEYHRHKEEIKCEISDIYHSHNGTDGYRTVHVYLLRRGYKISRLTVHKYMNTELQLFSIARRCKPDYEYGTPHKVFENKLQQDFKADTINQKWCTDFTYLFLTDGSKRYNCTIIDLHERIVIASITDKHITADLAKRTLQKAISSQPGLDTSQLILHSDQGSQFTSDKYIEFIRDNGIRQSMDGKSRWADNIMIERWFRSFKYEEAYLTEYANLKETKEAIGRYIYTYNFERCHQSIGNKRPAEVYYPVMLLDAARAAA